MPLSCRRISSSCVQCIQLRRRRGRPGCSGSRRCWSRTGRQQLQVGLGLDQRGEFVGLRDVAVDQPAEAVEAVLLDRHPHLERAEAARQLQAVLAEPERAAREAALGLLEVFRVSARRRRDAPCGRAPARRPPRTARAATCAGRASRSPRAPCRARGAGARAPARAARRSRRRRGTRGPRARRASASAVEIVRRAGVDRRRVADDAERLQARGAVRRDHALERAARRSRTASLTGTLRSDCAPRPSDSIAFCTQLCTSTGRVGHQRLRDGRDALGPDVDPGARIARHREADEVRHRAAAHQQAARLRPGSRRSPCTSRRTCASTWFGDVVAAAHVRVEHGREEIADGRERRAVAHEPGPEARMGVAHRVGQHQSRKSP